jgi:hypothetical protein
MSPEPWALTPKVAMTGRSLRMLRRVPMTYAAPAVFPIRHSV